MGGAARRLHALERRWLETPLNETPSVGAAVAEASEVSVLEDQTRFDQVRRYSFTEERPVEFIGAVGRVRLGGEGLRRALPWLCAGELLSLGSGTTFGFGRIELAA